VMRRERRRSATAYVLLDRSCCEACWQCLDVCPRAVLGKIDFLGHRHAKIRAAEVCNGCGRCVKVCTASALSLRAAVASPASTF
jgi:Pyruvate/2-oxoacid:ferredoxin oxidoreductase delta subunit